MRATELPPLALRAELFPLLVKSVPEIQQREEVGPRVAEARVRGPGGVLLVERPLAGILNAQAGGDDEQLARGVLALRLEQHPAERRINRQPGQVATEFREFAAIVQRAEFLEQRVAAGNGGGTNEELRRRVSARGTNNLQVGSWLAPPQDSVRHRSMLAARDSRADMVGFPMW